MNYLSRKQIYLSLFCATFLCANEATILEDVNIIESSNSILLKDISKEELKSADLAEALSKNSANIQMVRRNGIANDIILRGQKKDNINILIDNAKIYGACPNRMDPPTSHIVTNNIKKVTVIEGPYDVENFGTLSGLVKVETNNPKDGIHGELNLNAGSFNYKKASASIEAGTKNLKAIIAASTERSDAYKDGNGNNFLEQQKNSAVPLNQQYRNGIKKAFEKNNIFTKFIYNINDDQEFKLSYTANRSDEILYPSGPMDANYDNSDIYTLGYTIRDLGNFSKELNIDYYYSKVDHPMSGKLRVGNATSYMTNHLKSSIWGLKLKNSLEIKDSLFTFGVDTSKRNWHGEMYSTNINTGGKTPNPTMNKMYDTDTTNKAIFTKLEKSFGSFDLEAGARYDYTDIETVRPNVDDKKYVGLSGYIFTTYNINEQNKIFAGIGKSSRVPDARELYQQTSSSNPNLEQTKNYEVDFGYEAIFGNLFVKPKIFYSKLENYIYNSSKFENIDAKIYGADFSGYYYFTDDLSLDFSLAYLRGKKDAKHIDRDLAEIPPFKANLALNYEYKKAKFKSELVAVKRWSKYDKNTKEQELAGYAILNLKYTQNLFKNFDLSIGVDNILNKTYNSTNTYNDINYINLGGNQMLLNDMGRYAYLNLKYSF